LPLKSPFTTGSLNHYPAELLLTCVTLLLELSLDEVEEPRRDGETTPVPVPVPLPSGGPVFLLVTLVVLLVLLLVLLLPVAQLVTSRAEVVLGSHSAVHG
jgi:hypothetical protein